MTARHDEDHIMSGVSRGPGSLMWVIPLVLGAAIKAGAWVVAGAFNGPAVWTAPATVDQSRDIAAGEAASIAEGEREVPASGADELGPAT